jgi:hypothetical protein
MTERPIPKPTGTVQDATRVLRMMVKRQRESYPSLNAPDQDTIPGADSADE